MVTREGVLSSPAAGGRWMLADGEDEESYRFEEREKSRFELEKPRNGRSSHRRLEEGEEEERGRKSEKGRGRYDEGLERTRNGRSSRDEQRQNRHPGERGRRPKQPEEEKMPDIREAERSTYGRSTRGDQKERRHREEEHGEGEVRFRDFREKEKESYSGTDRDRSGVGRDSGDDYRDRRHRDRAVDDRRSHWEHQERQLSNGEAEVGPSVGGNGRGGRSAEGIAKEADEVVKEKPAEKPAGRSGGVYVPPFKLAQMMKDVDDKSSMQYQRLTWDALRKSINGLVNKVNSSNIKNILPELFGENLIRGRGLFARSCMKSQMASPTFTHVFAALVAVVNTKFPELGELLLKRVILQLKRSFKRNDKPVLLAAARFIAHLVNQQVAHEILALELLTLLLEIPTDDSVEVAVGFIKECGSMLQDLSPQGLHSIFERFRGILHEGEIDKRVQFMIEGLFAIRKARFQGFPAVIPELDLVEQEDQITHELSLEDDLDQETGLDIFSLDPNFVENEKKYQVVKKEIVGDDLDGSEVEDGEKESEEENDSEDEEGEEDEEEREARMQIQDETETNLVNLRRTIYLTIMSSVDFEEAGHKLLKIKLEPGQEMELCVMLLECCSQERTYLRYYGLLGQRFCMINRVYQENFDDCFVKQYSMIHRLETNKLRNVAKFFAHLLGTDALPWQALAYIRLTEEDTTSSSRIFIKILFQELSEHLGLRKLNERLTEPSMQDSFDGIFPKDNPKNTRFAINFFTSIGLGGLTDSLREYLKNMPRMIMNQHKPVESENEGAESDDDSDTSGGGSSDSDSSSSESDSDSDTTSGSPEQPTKKRRK